MYKCKHEHCKQDCKNLDCLLGEKKYEIDRLRTVLRTTHCPYTAQKIAELLNDLNSLVTDKIHSLREEINARR